MSRSFFIYRNNELTKVSNRKAGESSDEHWSRLPLKPANGRNPSIGRSTPHAPHPLLHERRHPHRDSGRL
mgnify:CR=1 FL=1